MLKRPQSPSDLDREQRKRTIGVVLRTLEAHEHFGGCDACTIHLALLSEKYRIGWESSVLMALQILEAMNESGRIDKFEGREVTTWKVRHEDRETEYRDDENSADQ